MQCYLPDKVIKPLYYPVGISIFGLFCRHPSVIFTPKQMKLLIAILLFLGFCSLARAQDIFSAARENDTLALVNYLKGSSPVDSTDGRGSTPLIVAVYNENEAATRILLNFKAKVDIGDLAGNTAMMGACFKGYLNMVQYLYKYHSNLNVLNRNGATALIFAATFGHTDIVKFLLIHHADRTIKDRFGKTALDYAVNQENAEVVELLKPASN